MKNQWKYLALATIVVVMMISTNSVYVNAYPQAESDQVRNSTLKKFYLAQQGGFIMSQKKSDEAKTIEETEIHTVYMSNDDNSHNDDSSYWEKTKNLSGEAWDKTKEITEDAWETSKEGADKAWKATKEGADKVWEATKDVTKKIVD